MQRLFGACVCCVMLTTSTSSLLASTIWNGPATTFTKPAWADSTLPVNQDFITDNVVITRGDSKGIFNIAQEPSYAGTDVFGVSPVDTQWAFGTTADYQTLTYTTWAVAANGNPEQNLVDQDMVLHLVTDDIFLDLKFLSWLRGGDVSEGGEGAGFSYQRSTLVPEPATILSICVGLLGWMAIVRRRRRER